MKGFSARNLKYMRAFASSYNLEIIQQYNLVADKLRTENISQKLVSRYLLSEQSVFVQQAVAQIHFVLIIKQIRLCNRLFLKN